MNKGRVTRAYRIICLLVFILFLQFGESEFLSVQFFLFILLLVICFFSLEKISLKIPLVASSLFTIILLSSIINNRDLHFTLMGLRTCAALGIVFLISVNIERRNNLIWSSVVQRSIYYSIILSMVLSLLQFYDSYYSNSGYFDIPETWFSLDYGTLFYERRSALVDYFVRPSGTYSEPSALGVLGLLGLFIAYGNQSYSLKYLSFALCLISSSLIALVFALGFLVYYELYKSRKNNSYLLVFIVLLVALFSISFFEMGLMGRIERIFSGGDASSNVRLFGPLIVIKEMVLQGYWFGVDENTLNSLMPDHVNRVIDTWIFNQFIFYGVFGLIVVFLAFYVSPRRVWPFLLSIMVANGDAFYYDRLFLLILAVVGSMGNPQSSSLEQGNRLSARNISVTRIVR